jgi:hypothetical protein
VDKVRSRVDRSIARRPSNAGLLDPRDFED